MKSPYRKLKVMVIGECGVDLITSGASHRMSPEAPVPVIHGMTQISKTVGLAANVVENIIALGASAELFSIIGKDDMGSWLVDQVRSSYFVTDLDRPTIIKDRLYVNGEAFARIDTESTKDSSDSVESLFLEIAMEHIHKYDLVILQDYGKGLWSNTGLVRFIRACNETSVPVFVDPYKYRDVEKYFKASVIKANYDEAKALTNTNDFWSPRELATHIEKRTGAVTVVTNGDKGMSSSSIEVPGINTIVSDVAGCGDTALSVLALHYTLTGNLKKSMVLANKAASIKVSNVYHKKTVSWEKLK